MYTLCSERLRVEVEEPENLIPLTNRFDHTAFITEVELDHRVRFCATEPRNMKSPSSGGRGICFEFCSDVSREAKLGQYYPKLGVGLVKKTEEGGFDIFKRYEYIPFHIVTEQKKATQLTFVTMPKECIGYAVRVTRTLQIRGTTLFLETSIENVGKKPISFKEYGHNFISLCGMALDEGYRLELPDCYDLEERVSESAYAKEFFSANLEGIGIRKQCCSSASVRLTQKNIKRTRVFRWRLSYVGVGAAVQGNAFFQPSEVTVWGNNHMLCPEIFCMYTVVPGGICTWNRSWEFEQWEPQRNIIISPCNS